MAIDEIQRYVFVQILNVRYVCVKVFLDDFQLRIRVIMHLLGDVVRHQEVYQSFLEAHLLTVRREHARDVGEIQRIARHLVQPVVENAGDRADHRDFEMTTEGQITRRYK